jgi:hypothetical protein
MWDVSRILAYGECLTFVLMEMAAFAVYRLFSPAVPLDKGNKDTPQYTHSFAVPLMIVDFILLVMAILTAAWIKQKKLVLPGPYVDTLMLLSGFWLATSIVTRKFNRTNFVKFYGAFSAVLKCVLLTAGGLATVFFTFRLVEVSWSQILGALGLYTVGEMVVFYLYSSWLRYRRETHDIEDAGKMHATLGAASSNELQFVTPRSVTEPVREKLLNALEFFNPELFSMIDKATNLLAIDRLACILTDTDNFFGQETSDHSSYQLLINLHKVNDMRWLNRYFILAHSYLQSGGYFVGTADTMTTHRAWFESRFPSPVDRIFYGFSFLWKRVFPKLPLTNKIYFAISQGRNRMLSRAEVLGRLYFCGFRVIAEKEIDNKFYFIAKKVGMVSTDENPTYGPLVRLRRFGHGGQPITVYKFRTMYPYSEYLQEYVYERQNLEKGGKFKDDFRVTSWGKFLRRTWLDELPMLYNWLKGDLQLLGVRPLSRQYLSLYSSKLKRMRDRVKPGLVPPFYADLPKTLDEIEESELRYIMSYLRKPFITQWYYSWRCFTNIIIKKARSA